MEYFEHLKSFCKRIEVCTIKRSAIKNIIDALKSIFLRNSFIISRDFVPEMQNLVDKITKEENPAFIHIDHLQMAQYVTQYPKEKKILDEHNVEFLIIERIYQTEKNIFKKIFAYFEYKKLKNYEKKFILESKQVFTVSDIDKKILNDISNNQVKINTIPIGVDTEYFSFKPSSSAQKDTIVFIGILFWPPNIEGIRWFYQKVWAKIDKEVKWKIVGMNPSKEILDLNKIDNRIKIYPDTKDVRPFMWDEGIFIVPLLSGSGIRVKILNAMACGIPVISTSIGAEGIEGLKPVISHQSPVTSKQFNIWIADEPDEFANAVITLLKNKNLREQISINGCKLIKERFTWDIQGEKLLKVYLEGS